MTEHLELDALADVLAGEPAPAHLSGCPQCAAELAELRTADAQVAAALRSLPAPPLPDGLADRLDAALAGARPAASVTTLPTAGPGRPARWLPAAAAAVLVLGGIGFGVTQLREQSNDREAGDAATSTLAGPGAGAVRNDTGTAYTGRPDLAAAVPGLLTGTAADSARVAAAPAPAQASPLTAAGGAGDAGEAGAESADPLARLRSDDGLAECLAAVLPPEDPSVRPLALDFGTFKGAPAMVLVLPGAVTGKLDVYVVGAGCSRADAGVLFYTSVDAP